ncbi:MAG TPA: hypothetical protein VJ861_10355 [Treponemataceae bacterium]|nr:hypothetical protein [Treponemataceae bacterium]
MNSLYVAAALLPRLIKSNFMCFEKTNSLAFEPYFERLLVECGLSQQHLRGEPTIPYTHFNSDERDVLQTMITMSLDISTIARILSKYRSWIYWEVNPNKTKNYYIAS